MKTSGGRLAMTDAERDRYLLSARTCRLATIGSDGAPRIAPLWFVWHGECLWLHSLVRSARSGHIRRDPRVAVTVDDGEEFAELRGVTIRGLATIEDPAPPERGHIESAYAAKYLGADAYRSDGRHEWIRVTPALLFSWDRRTARPR
ncbi:pyridoxamine 5'-phosphate oxidase family protein [Microbacterium sp. RD1]|uniref:pyridoxamine 5'-phosphate oxidase family protein n=1 Tax=Microbacterium sp. RD1 TaxID=3457313 RepID=UPI003FA5805E